MQACELLRNLLDGINGRYRRLRKGRMARNPARCKTAPRWTGAEQLEPRLLLSVVPHLLKDINIGTDDSFPVGFVSAAGTTFFTADDGVHGRELWKTDGTGVGTELVKDIHEGSTGSSPVVFASLGAELLFTADDGIDGRELWKSDGTEAGTVLVKELDLGGTQWTSAVLGEELFFGTTGGSVPGLYKSDGTSTGTELIKAFSRILHLTGVGETLFFLANDGGGSGQEFWKSDGTPEGTVLVKDINPGIFNSNPLNFTDLNGMVFFSAAGTEGRELWKSDGTKDGTVLVKDMRYNRKLCIAS